MNRKKIAVLLMASAIVFNTVNSISYVNVLAYELNEGRNLIMEEEIPQSQMTAVATSAQSGEDGSKAIDGNINTMWHTPWSITDNSKLPQSLTVDLGGSNNVSTIKVSPRTSQTNGIITKYEIYAINGDTETLVASGNWKLDNLAKSVNFDQPIKAEKIKITALEAGAGFASIAEVNVYRVKEGVEKVASYQNKKISDNNGIDISSDIEGLKNLESGTIISRFDTSKGDIQSLVSIGNNTVANGHFHLYVADNTVGFEVRNQSGNIATGKTSAVLNKGINTIALKVTSGDGYKIFINGKLAGEVKSTNATLSAGVVGINNAFIGKTDRSSGNEYPFSGYIDFVDIYGEAIPDKYLTDITGQTVLPSEEEILPDGMKTEPIDLFKPGDLGSQNFRIPALFTTKDGTVIASIDVRNQGGADAPWNDIDSGVRRKTLGGEWEEAQKVIDYPSRASVIDTALTQDEETGRIFLLVTTFPENYGFWQAQAGSGYTDIDGVKYRALYDASGNLYTIRESGNVYDSEGNITNYNVNVNSMELTKDGVAAGNVMTASCELKVYGTSYLSLIYSDDDGETWSEPIDINSDIKADWMKFLGTGPGAGIQVKNGEYAGRIVFPVYYTNGAGKQSSAVIYSDDHGETWNMGESPNDGRDLGNGSFGNSETMTDGLELTECQVVEMPNGQLKLFMRNTGSYVRIATSFDGGATWDSEVYEDRNLPEPYCQLSVMKYSQQIDGQDAIVFANPKGSGRTNGTVRFGIINQNGTHSNGEPRYEFEWRYNKLVKAGTYAYSCLTELPNGDIGLFYEGTDNQEMSYMEMSPEYIKFDYESSLEGLVNPGEIESIELLDGKNSYMPGDKINVKLSFNQAVSLIGNKNLTLKIGESKVTLSPITESNAREFTFEGVLPTTLSEGTFGLILEASNNTEILNTVGKNTTLSSDLDLSDKGGQIIINKNEEEKPDENIKPLAGYSNIRISNNNAVDISSDLDSFKSLTEGTIIARFDNANKSGIQSIIGIGNENSANTHFHLYTNGDRVGFEIRNGSNIATPAANVTLNNGINTLALKVTNGEGYKVFVNGTMIIDLKDSNARFLDAIDNINKAYIGKTPRPSGSNTYNFSGDVDFVEIYGTNLEDKVLLNKTAETILVSDLATAISSIEILDEKEEYAEGDTIKFKAIFNQSVSLVGDKNLVLKIGEGELPATLTNGENAKEFIVEAIIPKGIKGGTYNLGIKANENTAILNTAGNNITLSQNLELDKSITIKEDIDKSELAKVIENAKNIIENESDKYTEATINSLKEAVALAEETFANEVATQEQVDVAKMAVETAIDRLEEKVEKPENVNKVALKISIDYANELKEGGALEGVVSAVVEEFNKALEEAIAMYNNELATQSEVDTIFNKLVEAIHMLEFKQGDKSELENLINSANALNKGDYTEESWAKLEVVLQDANKVFVDENAMQDEVNEIVSKLQQAIKDLEEKKVDKTILQALVDKVKDTDSSKYIPSTWTQFENTLKAANSILVSESATQEEVDSSYSALLRSYLELRLTPDKSLLEDLIKEVESIDLSKYTVKSANGVRRALDDANKVLANKEASEDDVNKALTSLKNAKNSLVASSDSNSDSNSGSNSNNNGSTTNGNSNGGNSTTGKLPQTGTAGVAGTLISGIVALIGGLGLSRKKGEK